MKVAKIDPFAACSDVNDHCLETAPGDFTFIDKEGREQLLETFGIFKSFIYNKVMK